jgi:hypothetical protein
MRILLGFLSGVVGMLAGWFGLAMLVISFAGFDRDGGIAMGAFFQIGPIGGLVGFAAGVWLFVKVGVARRRISRPFAIAIIAIVGGLAWLGWYELIRSPYLTRGDMTLVMQFRLPATLEPPAEASDIGILLDEDGRTWPGYPSGAAWLRRDDGRAVILANVTMSYKTSRRVLTLSMPGAAAQSWTLDLASDPDPMSGSSGWLRSSPAPDAIELNYQLTADR